VIEERIAVLKVVWIELADVSVGIFEDRRVVGIIGVSVEWVVGSNEGSEEVVGTSGVDFVDTSKE
jgi:hypothetical protein